MVHVATQPDRSRFPGLAEAEAAHDLAARLPRLVLESRRVSASLAHGIHGRGRAGPGENFWQFRPFYSGESAGNVDWRRSARDGRLYVREREWEAAQTMQLWIDRSLSMAFASSLALAPKVERAIVLGLALAETLVLAGERVGYAGALSPRANRQIGEQIAQVLAADATGAANDLPPAIPLKRRDETLLIGDFLSPLADIERVVSTITSNGAGGHAIMIVDPVEETFPFAGQTELIDPQTGERLRLGEAAAWRDSYRQRIASHRAGLQDIMTRRGLTLTTHHTDRPASEAALRVLSLIASRRDGKA
ncbi:DUF58 domain-containing protein [Pseudochelatococcus contaminans]|uniref:Uncharacterized protein (DUF58 family) n=1 Tax=Pseudochelatococcus contaminans TaxID=1538103 RepID=A0A7W5Z684_9HYPH|nr:DUF58 domain-containing protein [Pseudochelatococcus contaminans]MBB3810764.1 uncharacterized protein (DUF58 family) [Pseudochelatococcus contaminans]